MIDRVTPWLDDGDVQLYLGDVCDVLRQLPAGIAQTCVTSPPYWGLRDYGTGQWTGGDSACDHLGPPFRTKAKINENCGTGADVKNAAGREPMGDSCSKCGARRVDQQLGLEATPELYVERMVAVFREVWRVLRDDGTLWLNLGDSYATGTSADRNPTSTSGDHVPASWSNRSQPIRRHPEGLKPKDLVGIPWRVAFALQADGWVLRSDVVWAKPNPMPESVTDRPTKAHEMVFLFAKGKWVGPGGRWTSQPYFYDADAVREPHTEGGIARAEHANHQTENRPDRLTRSGFDMPTRYLNPAGRNLRSVWEVATEPFPEAHFATYPQALVRRCIPRSQAETSDQADHVSALRRRTSGQWSCPACGCREVEPQLALDPFIGSGTTALVARRLGRHAIGIELSADYLEIAARRTRQLSLLGGAT